MAIDKTVRTTKGQEASAYLLAHGGTINFTKVVLGSGECNTTWESMTSLVDPKKELAIQSKEYMGGTQTRFLAVLDNSELTSDLTLREIGLYAIDPESEEEILFLYGNAKTTNHDYTETIPAFNGSGTQVMRFMNLDAYVCNAENATFTISNEGKADYLTVQAIRSDLDNEILNRTLKNSMEEIDRTNGDATTLASAKTYADGIVATEATARQSADTAMQTALSGKANASHTHAKSDVGLGNVDNTSDADKPISTAMQNALDGKANANETEKLTNLPVLPVGTDLDTCTTVGTWRSVSNVEYVHAPTMNFRLVVSTSVDNYKYQIMYCYGRGYLYTRSQNWISGTVSWGSWVCHSGGQTMAVDSALSSTSTNPVQNKVINSAIDDIGVYQESILRQMHSISTGLTSANTLTYMGKQTAGFATVTILQFKNLQTVQWITGSGTGTITFPCPLSTLYTAIDITASDGATSYVTTTTCYSSSTINMVVFGKARGALA